MRIANPLTRLA